MSRVGFNRAICLGSIVFALLFAVHTSAVPDHPSTQILWEIDLPQSARESSWRPELGGSGVAFENQERLIVYQVEPTFRLSPRTEANSFQFHAHAFTAASGLGQGEMSWSTKLRGSSFSPADGGFVVRTGDMVRFLKSDFTEVAELSLPSDADSLHDWVISASADGKVVLLNHSDSRQSELELRDGETFQVLKKWRAIPALRRMTYSISDTGIVTADQSGRYVLYAPFGTDRWQPIGRPLKVGCVKPFVINPSTVASNGCELKLVALDGRILRDIDIPLKNESFEGKIAAAAKADLFAVTITEGKGGGFSDTDVRLTGMRVAVYSVSLGRQVASIPVLPLPQTSYDFALSPDGSKVAVLDDSHLSVYGLR